MQAGTQPPPPAATTARLLPARPSTLARPRTRFPCRHGSPQCWLASAQRGQVAGAAAVAQTSIPHHFTCAVQTIGTSLTLAARTCAGNDPADCSTPRSPRTPAGLSICDLAGAVRGVPRCQKTAPSARLTTTHRLICFLACLPRPLPSCPACPWPNNEMLVALSSARPPHFGRSHPPWPDFGPSLASPSPKPVVGRVPPVARPHHPGA